MTSQTGYSSESHIGRLGIASVVALAVMIGGGALLLPNIALAALFALAAAALVSLILLRPERLLLIFILLLPLHQLLMMTLLHFSDSWTLVRLAQPWKDLLALATLAAVIGIWIDQRRTLRFRLLDGLIVAHLAINVLYLFGPWDTSFTVRLFGLRTNTFLVIFYLLGRLIPLSPRRQYDVLTALLVLGIMTGLFAFIDRFLLPIDWPARIGFTEYVSQGSGTIRGRMGLSWTFWTATGLRRSSSFFANPLDLAASTHLTGVTALVVALSSPRRSRRRLLAWVAFFCTVAALLMAVSRMSTAVFFLEVMLILLLLRHGQLIPPLLVIVFCAGLVVLALHPQLSTLIYETITFENPSSRGHLERWQEGVEVLAHSPLGLGPGTSGRVGARFGSQIGGESQYVVLGVEMGIVGIVLYILIQWTALVFAFHLFKHSGGPTKQLALVAFVSRLGIALAGITAPIESYLFVAFVNWWLIGFVTQQLSPGRPRHSYSPNGAAPGLATSPVGAEQ